MAYNSSSEEVSNIVGEFSTANRALYKFLNSYNNKFVSLGENCSTAWYLKQVGLKKESYPFDWAFSSPQIILDCIDDGFLAFLDKTLIKPKNNEGSACHSYYHANLFNHRNPLKSDANYGYYQRCCNRFNNLIQSNENIVYVITLINEPDKRPDWASGFTQGFSLPINQGMDTVQALINKLLERNENSQYLIIDHYTNQRRSIEFECISDKIFFVKFFAAESSTGLYYSDPLDDFCFKFF